MINYIKAELYRNFNRLYFWLFTAIVTAGGLMMNISLKLSNVPEAGMNYLFEAILILLGAPVFMVIAFIDMVTSEEQKNLTLRNTVDFGVPRSKIIISKFIATVILGFISAAIILTVYLGCGFILFGVGSGVPGGISINILRFLVATLLWMAAISVGTFLALVFKNNNAFAFVYVAVFLVTSGIIRLLAYFVSDKFNYIDDVLITTQLNHIKQTSVTNYDLGRATLIAIIYIVVFLIISILYFDKQEVK